MSDQEAPTIIIIADGWTRRVFLDMLENNQLPEIATGLIDQGGLIENVVSNLPSVSIASHSSILTGTFQDEHGIPGHRWRDTQTGKITNYLGVNGRSRVNRDLSSDVETVFERNEDSISLQGIVRRGARRHESMPTMRSDRLLQRTGELAVQHPHSTIVTWLPRGDALGHTYGPDSPQVREEMRQTSRAVGKLLLTLEASRATQDARLLLVPDHGHRPVSHATDLCAVLARTKVGALPVNPRWADPDTSIALTSGDASAYLYLPTLTAIAKYEVAVEVAQHASVEMVCWTAPDGTATFASKLGVAAADRLQDGTTSYSVHSGVDPLGLISTGSAQLDLRKPAVTLGRYPDFLHQFLRSDVPGRSGDMLVLASSGTHFSRAPRVAWRFGYHRGSHGGPFSDEVLVAAAFRGPVPRGGMEAVRSADLLSRLGFLAVPTALRSPM
jgi:Type I phosphodiesterase / nucleotide pyrophosphatase